MQSGRVRLFERGAEATGLLGVTGGTEYICPICGDQYDKAAVEEGRLTLEHVPPRSQGGKGLVLTCELCNNRAGHTVDAHLHRRAEMEALERAIRGEGTASNRPVAVEYEGTQVNATAHVHGPEGIIYLDVHEERNNPARTEHQRAAAAASAAAGLSGTVRISAKIGWDERQAQISELRAAFLLAFARFGYSYALHARLEAVRRQIREPEAEIIRVFSFPAAEEGPLAMRIAVEPFWAVLVRIGRAVVVLPWNEGDHDVYGELERLIATGVDVALPGLKVAVPQTLEMDQDFAPRPI